MWQLRLPVLHFSLLCASAGMLHINPTYRTWYLNDQLQKTVTVTGSNKEYLVETLRSIAELLIWGDQHDPSFFDFFMEKQVMAHFMNILRSSSRSSSIAVQLLQTLSILIQNIGSKHAIYYLFSNEHINNLITYSFDFRHEEVLAYYISFLRTISTKLDKTTVSFFIKTEDNEVVSFPLYSEAIKFFHHEESMVRIAVRTLTLNVYHVEDESIRKFVISSPVVGYFSDLVEFIRQQSFTLDGLVAEAAKSPESSHTIGRLEAAIAEIGDLLYYCYDIMSAGLPDLGELMTNHILRLLVMPLLMPSFFGVHKTQTSDLMQMSALSATYLLSRLLHVVKHKALVNGIAAALLRPAVPPEAELVEGKDADSKSSTALKWDEYGSRADTEKSQDSYAANGDSGCVNDTVGELRRSPREALISNLFSGNDKLVLAALCVFVSLLQSEDLDDSLLDTLGLLSQRKRHRKLLLQALMGTKPDEELGQLFDRAEDDLALELQNLKVSAAEDVVVVDALMQVLCQRPPLCVEALWHSGWLIRQLVPHLDRRLSYSRSLLLKNAYAEACKDLLPALKGAWCDIIPSLLKDEWKISKKAFETPFLQNDSSFVLMPHVCDAPLDDDQSSSVLGERMRASLKVFVALHQMHTLLLDGPIQDEPPLGEAAKPPSNARTNRLGVDLPVVKAGTEFELIPGDAMPCRVSFERGKERNVYLLAVSEGVSGWLVLAEDVPNKAPTGIIRITAALAGCSPRIDQDHPRWLHLRIRSPNQPSAHAGKLGTLVGAGSSARTKRLVDGRWTLAFPDEAACRHAFQAVSEELALQATAVEEVLRPILGLPPPSAKPPPEVESDLGKSI